MSTQRVLPAKVYDALQLSALMHGGIGAFKRVAGEPPMCLDFSGPSREESVPVCYLGHLWHDGLAGFGDPTAHGIGIVENDAAVSRIMRRRGIELRTPDDGERNRVTFEDWCAELNVVRGPEEPSEPVSCASEASDVLAASA